MVTDPPFHRFPSKQPWDQATSPAFTWMKLVCKVAQKAARKWKVALNCLKKSIQVCHPMLAFQLHVTTSTSIDDISAIIIIYRNHFYNLGYSFLKTANTLIIHLFFGNSILNVCAIPPCQKVKSPSYKAESLIRFYSISFHNSMKPTLIICIPII